MTNGLNGIGLCEYRDNSGQVNILSEEDDIEYIEYSSSKYYRGWHREYPGEENMFDHLRIDAIFPSMFLYHSPRYTG